MAWTASRQGLAAIASATFLAVAIIQGGTETPFIAKQLKLARIFSAILAGHCASAFCRIISHR